MDLQGPASTRAHRQRLAQPARDAQHLQFVGEGESVAGLDLHRGRAVGDERGY
jgi:hypothetical protein